MRNTSSISQTHTHVIASNAKFANWATAPDFRGGGTSGHNCLLVPTSHSVDRYADTLSPPFWWILIQRLATFLFPSALGKGHFSRTQSSVRRFTLTNGRIKVNITLWKSK